MSRILPHAERDGVPHFVTFVTHLRWILPSEARSVALDSCRHDHLRTMDLHVAVVMPDHVHLILTPLVDYDRMRVWPLERVIWAIKSASAHRINRLLQRSGSVWQEEYFDHVLRSSESLQQKIDYVRENPVRAGLCENADSYEWTWFQPRPRAAAAVEIRVR